MLFFANKHKKRSNRPHGELLQTALAIIQHQKPRKFKDVTTRISADVRA